MPSASAASVGSVAAAAKRRLSIEFAALKAPFTAPPLHLMAGVPEMKLILHQALGVGLQDFLSEELCLHPDTQL